MFRCPACKKVQSSGSKPVKITTKTRKKQYQNEVKAGKFKKVIQSEGFETVAEVSVCSTCAQARKAA